MCIHKERTGEGKGANARRATAGAGREGGGTGSVREGEEGEGWGSLWILRLIEKGLWFPSAFFKGLSYGCLAPRSE